MSQTSLSKLGIIAGAGQLPRKIIEVCVQQGRQFSIIAFENQTDPQLIENLPHIWCRLGQTKKALDYLKQQGVQEIVMVGPIKRPSWSELKPDAFTATWLAKHLHKILGDDSLLRAIIHLIECEGFTVVSAENIIGNSLLAPHGVLGKHRPDSQDQQDISLGLKIATILGSCDVGQAVMIQQGLVLGVEAIEGTEALLKRCASLKRAGSGGVLVKITKPQQEVRVDRPTVGLETLKRIQEGGFRGLAVEAFGVIMLNKEEMIQFADEHQLFLIGVERRE
ncbi:hypothetical protein IM40_07725 [Candidatus Paracaedimonas acanthamoebae]|nr:hypothetical protein IM40_07725 [Candidatus Paracaedimonas acanthamoebae]